MLAARTLVALLALVLGGGALLPARGSAETTGGTPSSNPTFSKDVLPILQRSCQDCHRPGYIAPMSLLTYEDARPWVKSIRNRVIARQMPPWHIDRTVGIQHFKNDRSLSDDEIDTIVRWVDAGSPRGNPEDMPPPRQFADDNVWGFAAELGPPDLVLKSAPYTVKAVQPDAWWKPSTPTGVTEPRWVRAI